MDDLQPKRAYKVRAYNKKSVYDAYKESVSAPAVFAESSSSKDNSPDVTTTWCVNNSSVFRVLTTDSVVLLANDNWLAANKKVGGSLW